MLGVRVYSPDSKNSAPLRRKRNGQKSRQLLDCKTRHTRRLKQERRLDVGSIKGGKLRIEYLAGIIDGEGTITINKDGNQMLPVISISNTNLKMLNAVAAFLRRNKIKSSICNHGARKKNHKEAYSIRVRWDGAIKLAKMLDGLLIIKSRQCKILSKDFKNATPRNGKYSKSQLRKKETLIRKIRLLNSRGV